MFESTLDRRIDATPDSQASAKMALEALTTGVSDGFSQRVAESKEHPWQLGVEFVAAAALGGFLARTGKIAQISVGGLGLMATGSQLAQGLGQAVDIFQHPENFEKDKASIADSLGRNSFDLLVTGLAGGASWKTSTGLKGSTSNLAASSAEIATRAVPRGLTGTDQAGLVTLAENEGHRTANMDKVFGQCDQLSNDKYVAIPQYTRYADKEPTITMADRTNGLGKFYLDNRKAIVRVLGENSSSNIFHVRGGTGTGFFVNSDGLIATNNHVISGFDKIQVETAGGQRYFTRVVARDRLADLALIQVLNPRGNTFTALPLATDSALPKNGFAAAIGHPEGVPQEVLSMGQYKGSAVEAEKQFAGGLGDRTPRVGNLITNLPVKSGFSGSPLISQDGKVVGVVKAELQGSTASAATAVEHLNLMMRELRQNPPIGGWLDINSIYDTSLGRGQAFKVSSVERMEWPVDKNNPINIAPNRAWAFEDSLIEFFNKDKPAA